MIRQQMKRFHKTQSITEYYDSQGLPDGLCYLLFFKPAFRSSLAIVLGRYPKLKDVFRWLYSLGSPSFFPSLALNFSSPNLVHLSRSTTDLSMDFVNQLIQLNPDIQIGGRTLTNHKTWNQRLICNTNFKKKIFRRIYNRIQQNQVDLLQRHLAAGVLQYDEHVLDQEGVIYAIVHLPSSRVYVGQTIKSAYSRLKSHWYDRSNHNFRNKGLHAMMTKQQFTNFIVWPLERIDPELYTITDTIDKKRFRAVANIRETFWIKKLRSLSPCGLNLVIPARTRRSRREPRPHRWQSRGHVPICTDCVLFDPSTASVRVHTHPGPDSHIRDTISSWLESYDTYGESHLTSIISKCSMRHRMSIRRWLLLNVKGNNISDAVMHIESSIRLLQMNSKPSNTPSSDPNYRTTDQLKIVHANALIDLINLNQILRNPDIMHFYHRPNPPLVCDKLVSPLSTYICNFSRTAKSLTNDCDQLPPHPCPCTVILPNCKDLIEGHICTTDHNIIPNTWVRSQFSFGCKQRHHLSNASIVEALTLGLDDFIKAQNVPVSIQTGLLLWKEHVLRAAELALNNNQHRLKAYNRSTLNDKLYLGFIKHNFAITRVDKLSHNLALICKRYYQYSVYKELHSGSYAIASETPTDVLSRHQHFNSGHNYKHVDVLPYLYAIPKMHKSPPKLRFIAGVSNLSFQPDTRTFEPISSVQRVFNRRTHKSTCSTTAASSHLSQILQTVMFWLRKKDTKNYINTGLKRCWFVSSADEVFYDIKKNAQLLRGRKPRTFDFTTMYTCLPHSKILTNLKIATTEAIDYHNHVRSTTSKFDTTKILPSLESIMELVQFVVTNTYLTNSPEIVVHQTIGLPMGTNSAPELANLTLYVDEASYVDHLIRTGDRDRALQYAYTYRYIDDILIWDITPPTPADYGLEYSEQTLSDGSVTFLGACIANCPNGWIQLSVFDKTKEWTFPVIRYPHASTNAPTHTSRGIFQGQLHRYRTICNSLKAFKMATTSLTVHMLARDHNPSHILRAWNAHLITFAHDRITNYPKLRFWFRRMLHWASHPRALQSICNKVPTLSRSTNNQPIDSSLQHNDDNITSPTPPTVATVGPTENAAPETPFPHTDILVINHLDDPSLRADRDKMAKYKDKIDFRRHSPNPECLNTLQYCQKCQLPFLNLRRHQRSACEQAFYIRERILNLHYRRCTNINCTSSKQSVLPLWCKHHALCIDCHITRSGPTICCSLHNCPTCGIQPPNAQEQVHLGIPRTPNDCGLYSINNIIHSFNINNPESRRELCSDAQLRAAVESREASWSYGMVYDLQDLFFVLRTLHFFYATPFIMHPNSSIQIRIPDNTVGILINHSQKEHFFCLTRSGPYWTLRDSLRDSIPIGRTDDFQQLLLAYHRHSASVSLILEEMECDFCHMFADGTSNLATDIRPCGIHFICPPCHGRTTTTDGLYQCDLCVIQKDIYGDAGVPR